MQLPPKQINLTVDHIYERQWIPLDQVLGPDPPKKPKLEQFMKDGMVYNREAVDRDMFQDFEDQG